MAKFSEISFLDNQLFLWFNISFHVTNYKRWLSTCDNMGKEIAFQVEVWGKNSSFK